MTTVMTNNEGTNDCKCSSKQTNDSSPKQPAAVKDIAAELSKQLKQVSERAQKPLATIHRVPEALRKLSESAYTPRLVSIGPLHCEDKHLKSSQMQEDIKMSYVNSLLDRMNKDRMDKEAKSKLLQKCVEEMRNLLVRAKEIYAGEPDIYSTLNETMLVTDGCFILELFFRHHLRKENQENEEDLVFSRPLVRNFIQQDLLLIENQLPFSFLAKLFELTLAPIANHDLGFFVLGYFEPVLTDLGSKCTNNGDGSDLGSKSPIDCVVKINNGDDVYHHILHFLHDHYRPRSHKTHDDNGDGSGSTEEPDQNNGVCHRILHFLHNYYRPHSHKTHDDNCNEFKHSATDLVYAGVKFEPAQIKDPAAPIKDPASPIKDRLKVNFREVGGPFNCWRRGRFQIPTLRITDATEPFLRNLIAFEQCCPSVPNHITWYAYLMDTLINDAEDVRVLEKAKVLCNTLGSHKEASNLFNKLCQEVVLGEFYFASECKRAVEYSDRWLPKNIADLKRNYFSSPWTCAAFVVAFLAFGMALTRFIRSF